MFIYSDQERGTVARTAQSYRVLTIGTFQVLLTTTNFDMAVEEAIAYPPPNPGAPPTSTPTILPDLSGKVAQDALEAFFNGLANEWHRERDMASSPAQITSHPAYQRIISMGYAALPLIIGDLMKRGGNWYAALQAITGANPVPTDADVPAAKAAWSAWAQQAGYVA